MNIPQVFLLVTGGAAALLFVAQRWERWVNFFGVLVAGLLAGLAWRLPIGERLIVGPFNLPLEDTWNVLGRRFVLGESDRPMLMVLFLGVTLWLGAAFVARSGKLFVPAALGITALLTAAIAVQPFLYSALLLELAVLLSIPLLARPGQRLSRGVVRFLTLTTLGVPVILFTGWMLSGVEASPADLTVVLRASAFLGLGFAFLLAIVPFHTWIPMIAEESHPYTAAFIFLIFPGAVSFMALNFLDSFPWLRNSEEVFRLIRGIGVLMVVTAGVLAAFQRHLGRLLGYAVLLEIGLSLVAIGLGHGEQAAGYRSIFYASLLPRGLSLGVWALALTALKEKYPDLTFRSVQGASRVVPVITAAVVMAHFSLAGLPLLAGFPVRNALWEGLAEVSLSAGVWFLFGNLGLMVGALRTLAVFVMAGEDRIESQESWPQKIYLGIGMVALFLVGLFPQWFLPIFANMPLIFENSVR